MSKRFKKKYDTELYWHEMLDRAHCVNAMLEEMLMNHPIADHPAIRAKLEEASVALGDLYQTIGTERFTRFP